MPEVYRTELTPLSFLERSAIAYPNKTAIVHGERSLSYGEMAAEATRTARALRASGIEAGDRVAYLCLNIPEMLIAHFAVPLLGAVLVAINTRLSPEEIRLAAEGFGLAALGPGLFGTAVLAGLIHLWTDRSSTSGPWFVRAFRRPR